MNYKKIPLYETRTFTAKFDNTFEFMKQNWKPYLRFLTYFLLPLSLVQALSLNTYMQTVSDMQSLDGIKGSGGALLQFLAGCSATAVCSVVGFMLLFAVSYALMKAYADRNGDIRNISFAELKPSLMPMLRKSVAVMALSVAFAAVVVALMVLMGMLFLPLAILPFFAALAVCVPLMLLYPIYLFEDITMLEAVRKSLNWGFKTWGGIAAITFVVSLIIGFASNLISIPYSMLIMIKSLAGISSGFSVVANSPAYVVITYLFGVLTMFASYLGYAILTVAIAYQYGHTADKLGDMGIMNQIDNFDEDAAGDEPGRSEPYNYGSAPRMDEIDDFEKL